LMMMPVMVKMVLPVMVGMVLPVMLMRLIKVQLKNLMRCLLYVLLFLLCLKNNYSCPNVVPFNLYIFWILCMKLKCSTKNGHQTFLIYGPPSSFPFEIKILSCHGLVIHWVWLSWNAL
jgi:chromate transport protein ChrA